MQLQDSACAVLSVPGSWEEAFLLTVRAFLLTLQLIKLLGLQSLKALIRRTFPL